MDANKYLALTRIGLTTSALAGVRGYLLAPSVDEWADMNRLRMERSPPQPPPQRDVPPRRLYARSPPQQPCSVSRVTTCIRTEEPKKSGGDKRKEVPLVQAFGEEEKAEGKMRPERTAFDWTFTVSLGHTIGPSSQDIISQDSILHGVYPTTIRELDGSVRPSPISIVRDQLGPSIHFLDMEIVQLRPGTCEVKMYDKRDNMPTLASYRFCKL